MIKTLVGVYSEAAKSRSDWSMFPVWYREELEELGSDAARKQDQMRVVADFIASMPEPEAVKLAQRLSGTDLGSVLDTYTR